MFLANIGLMSVSPYFLAYREVARIPQGALTIEVNESVASRNYLGIVSNLSRLYFGSQNLPESGKIQIVLKINVLNLLMTNLLN